MVITKKYYLMTNNFLPPIKEFFDSRREALTKLMSIIYKVKKEYFKKEKRILEESDILASCNLVIIDIIKLPEYRKIFTGTLNDVSQSKSKKAKYYFNKEDGLKKLALHKG